MHFANVLALLSLGSSAHGYMIKIYSEPNCSGSVQEINVYDNTCRSDNLNHGTQSFEVTAYGGGRQRANFYSRAHICSSHVGDSFNSYWADGGSDSFLKGRCNNLGFTANSYGSWHVA